MRLLQLMLSFLVSMSLLGNASEVLAAPLGYASNGKKQPSTYIKRSSPNNSGDVWERIRLGMKIPRPELTQTPSKQVLISEKNRLTKAYALRDTSHTPEAEVMSGESTQSVHPEPKYIIHPNTAIAPANNYTALGIRLKFGTKTPSASDEGCMPISSGEQALKSHGMLAHPQLRKRTVLASPNDGALQSKAGMIEPVAQAVHNSMPCNKLPGQQLVDTSNRGKQNGVEEKSSTKNVMISERINKQIAQFSQRPGYLYQVAERAHPYLYHIVEGLSKSQLPLDLALLPIVESGYQPRALSPKGAAGLWQFIPSTGKDYDLKQSKYYDDRLDILASTQAAIRFLSDLKAHFNGDWLLALAAYNCGQGAVDKAINRNIADGLDTDYWSLRLPEETQDYVPRLLALANIFASPEIYGLKFTPIKNEPYFVKVRINREVDISSLTDKNFSVLAKLANLSHEQFCRLNPGYLNPALSRQQSYTFLLPMVNANQLRQQLTSIAQFMAEPVSPTMNSSNSEPQVLPFSWSLSPNPYSKEEFIGISRLSTDI